MEGRNIRAMNGGKANSGRTINAKDQSYTSVSVVNTMLHVRDLAHRDISHQRTRPPLDPSSTLLPTLMRTEHRSLIAAVVFATFAHAQVYDSPEAAKADPDFALQGEYVDDTRGMQVIAEGDGEFRVKIYKEGLPGAGWDGSPAQEIEADDQSVAAMIRNFKRIDRTSPTLGANPPGGAVVLFDGTEASLQQHWKKGARMTDDGLLMEGCTSIDTFGDYSIHLEFRLPFMPEARGQARGNSGLYHQGRYETQVLDSFGLQGKNNETGGIYEIRDPDANLCLPPLAWQTYDVDFIAARYSDEGKKLANAKITVRLNGVVVHRDVELPRATRAAPVKEGPEDGPIYLQNHGNPVRFRNIWVKPRDVAAEARRPIVPGFERFHSGTASVQGGRLLLGELNCVACHQVDDRLSDLIDPKQAPILDSVGKRVHPEWMIDYLANPRGVKPGTTMPDVMSGMDAQQRSDAAVALTNFLVGQDAISIGGERGDTAHGERLFHQSGCVACHMPRNGDKTNAATSVPLVGIDEKYSRGSLQAFLKDPLVVRPGGRMPRIDLGEKGWVDVAQYLTGDMSIGFGNGQERPKKPNMKYSVYHGRWETMPDLDSLDPVDSGRSRGLDISVAGRNEGFAIRFDGFLPIEKAGVYRFRLSSDDGSALYIDNKKVIDNDGVHANQAVESGIRLTAAVHAIRVDYFELGGEEVLSLEWAGESVKSGLIDTAIVINRSDSAPPSESQSEPVDAHAFVFDAALAEQGRRLFSSLGCAACHERTDNGKSIASERTAPRLADCNPARGCLAGERDRRSPNHDLLDSQSNSLALAISAASVSAEPTADMQLSHRMQSLNCYACHIRGELGGPESDRNAMFISNIPEMGDEGRLPPPLDGVGDKLRQNWMNIVVDKGDKSRQYMKTFMPGFGKEHGNLIAETFARLDARSDATVSAIDEPPHRIASTGRQLVGSKGLACVSCHTFGKFKSTGIQAIALDTMAERIRQDWFHRYLPDPQVYRPGTRMPTSFPDGKSTVADVYDGDPGRQESAMWEFLKQGTRGGVPEGIVSGMIELKPETKPIIYRNFIDGVSPRGIAVGYPEKVNLCWDANNLSLRLIWQDRFIDASKHWVGRGPGNQTPLGGSVMRLETTAPLAVLSDDQAAWPTEPPKSRGYKFLGYRLDKSGRPTFRYRSDAFSVEDKPIAIQGDATGTLRREITVAAVNDPDARLGNVFFRAASGNVNPSDDGWFIVDDSIRIQIESSAEPILRTIDGQTELLVPIKLPETITQRIVW
jgi:mono/diheme cytochrome c family protein